MKIRAMSCTHCGGSVAPPEGEHTVSCSYCDTGFYCLAPGYMPHFRIHGSIRGDRLEEELKKLFSSSITPRDLEKKFTIVRTQRLFLPFYLLYGLKGGSLYFQKVDRERELLISEDTRTTIGPFQYVYFAATFEKWDLHDTDLRSIVIGNLKDIKAVTMGRLAGEGEIIDADLPVERIIEKGVSSGTGEFKDLKVLELKTAIVHLPVISVTIRYRQKLYEVTLDEVEGTLIRGRLPFRQAWAFMAGLPLTALLGWMTGRMIWVWKAFASDQASNLPLMSLFFVFVAITVAVGLQAALVLLKTPYQVILSPRGQVVHKVGRTPGHPFPWLTRLVGYAVDALREATSTGREKW